MPLSCERSDAIHDSRAGNMPEVPGETSEHPMARKKNLSKCARKAVQRKRNARRQGVIKVRKPGGRMKGAVTRARRN